MAQIDEIVDGVYRIATPPDANTPITFNQFLIEDEAPMLIHTGVHQAYDGIRKAVSEVLDPASLAYIVLLHFEGDECGGLEGFMDEAPNAELVGSDMSAILSLTSFGFECEHRVKGVRDGDVIDTGRHKLRFLETPHVHHWDSMMIFEESTKSVFPSDLYIQPGDQPPVVTEDLGAEMCGFYREVGIFAHEEPVRRCVDRLEALDPQWMHAMHGGTIAAEALPHFTRALREQPFAYQGKLLGRPLEEPAAAQT